MAIETYTLASGEKRYKAVAYLEDKTKKRKSGFKTKREAKKWIAEMQVLGVPKPKSEMTYGELVDEWLDAYRLTVKPSTYNTAKTEIASSYPVISRETLVRSIDKELVSELAQYYSLNYCSYVVRLARIKAIFEYAVNEEIIEDSPFKRLKKPKQRKKGKEYTLWSIENLNDFLEACKRHRNPMIFPAFRLLAYSGMRDGELSALKWSDLEGNLLTISRTMTRDYDNNYVVGDSAKTNAGARVVALDDETVKILRDWQLICPSEDRMFPAPTHSIISVMHHIIRDNPHIPDSTPHKLRHLHCSILLDAKVNVKDVQERLGHKDVQTTLNVYAHANPNKTEMTDIFTNALAVSNR